MSRRSRPATCKVRSCTDPYYALDMCRRHWAKGRRVRAARGLREQVDAAPVLAHIERLRRRGWTWNRIAVAANSSRHLLGRLERGEHATLPREKADRLLAIDPVWQDTTVPVPFLGTRRRLNSLAWNGWSGLEITRRLDLSAWVFTNGAYTGTTEARVASAVARFYDEHADQPGPNPSFAKKARTEGAISPAAWDDEDIDDPNAQPVGLRAGGKGARLLDNVEDLLAVGLSLDEIAAQLDVRKDSIQQAQRRAEKRAAQQDDAA